MSNNVHRVACVQVNASLDVDANLNVARELTRQAVADGAELVAFPENVACIAHGRQKLMERAFDPEDNRALAFFCDLARDTRASLLLGSLHVRATERKAANRSFLIDPSGSVVAWYDKIHMFDVDLAGGESYRESAVFEAGSRAVIADIGWAKIGMTICYDVRFPSFYRNLAHAGANVMAVPAAFTQKTGKAHWHTLLRSRAIETGSFVLAPAQTGVHDEGRETFGHSLIISPWGEILGDAGTDVGFIAADLDFGHVIKARTAVPSLDHDRAYQGPDVMGGNQAEPMPLSAASR